MHRRIAAVEDLHGDGYVSQSDEEEELHQKFKEQGIPTPIIKIDNRSDNFATVVSMEFGDHLGELADTVSTPAALVGPRCKLALLP